MGGRLFKYDTLYLLNFEPKCKWIKIFSNPSSWKCHVLTHFLLPVKFHPPDRSWKRKNLSQPVCQDRKSRCESWFPCWPIGWPQARHLLSLVYIRSIIPRYGPSSGILCPPARPSTWRAGTLSSCSLTHSMNLNWVSTIARFWVLHFFPSTPHSSVWHGSWYPVGVQDKLLSLWIRNGCMVNGGWTSRW